MSFNPKIPVLVVLCAILAYIRATSAIGATESAETDWYDCEIPPFLGFENDREPASSHAYAYGTYSEQESSFFPWGLTHETVSAFDNAFGADTSYVIQCLNTSVPYFWDDPSQGNFTLITRRIFHSGSQPGNGQIWLLSGGPGNAGGRMVSTARMMLTYLQQQTPSSHQNFTVYLPDHRGTGSSAPLTCPTVWSARQCFQEVNTTLGNKLQGFRTTYAAMDLAYLITLSRQVNETSYLYGVSYGTYWANRYLLIAGKVNASTSTSTDHREEATEMSTLPPHFQRILSDAQTSGRSPLVDAVVLDGICPPDSCRKASYDIDTNRVGILFMAHCQNDEFCRSKFANLSQLLPSSSVQSHAHTQRYLQLARRRVVATGSKFTNMQAVPRAETPSLEASTTADPLLYLLAMDEMLRYGDWPCNGKLSINVTSALFRQRLAKALMNHATRVLVAPLVYRMFRCAAGDIPVLNAVFLFDTRDAMMLALASNQVKGQVSSLPYVGTDQVLNWNILYSEMWNGVGAPDVSCDATAGISQDNIFGLDAVEAQCRDKPYWGTYAPDKHDSIFADTHIPMLLLNGDLDPQTAVWQMFHAARHFNKPGQQSIMVPLSPHCTLCQAMLEEATPRDPMTCGFLLTMSFLFNPNHRPDTSCLQKLMPLDWKVSNQFTLQAAYSRFGTRDAWGDNAAAL